MEINSAPPLSALPSVEVSNTNEVAGQSVVSRYITPLLENARSKSFGHCHIASPHGPIPGKRMRQLGAALCLSSKPVNSTYYPSSRCGHSHQATRYCEANRHLIRDAGSLPQLAMYSSVLCSVTRGERQRSCNARLRRFLDCYVRICYARIKSKSRSPLSELFA